MMPFVLSCVMLLYGALYLLGFQVIRDVFGDMNVMFCSFMLQYTKAVSIAV